MCDTLTPELELSAARMDVQCCTHRLACIAASMRLAASVPASADLGHAHAVLTLRADRGDATAIRRLAEYRKAATALEGARVALAELTAGAR